jgi:hypothetical protein
MKSKMPLDVRGTKDDFIPFYASLDSNSKLYKSITDTINLIKKEPARGDHVAQQNSVLLHQKIQDKDTL